MKQASKANVLVAAASLAFCGFVSTASAVPLPVVNASFESGTAVGHSPATCPGPGNCGILYQGWRFAIPAGSTGISGIETLVPGSVGNLQAGFTVGQSSISQQIAATIIPGATYTLSAMLGQTSFGAQNYRMRIGYNQTPGDPSTFVMFADQTFNLNLTNSFILKTISAVAPAGATGNVAIVFSSGGNHELWDQVQLNVTTTPLPAALPLFASGLGVLAFLARRRKQKGAVAAAI